MTDGSATRENEALRERISRLSAAILRINASLDVATVLQEVVDSARALTAARYGIIATVDDAGAVQDFVASGFTREEHDQLASWPDGPRLFERLRDNPGRLRLEDLRDYLPSLGFSPDLMPLSALQGVPMNHREHHVGNFFLAGKEGGGEFTGEDEELLALFASQAAATIANARTHRDERRARANLEALIDTSPVGVVVFDARTGRPVSFNREARRIVEELGSPDRPVERVLEVITCRYADGRELSLEEVPLAQQLGSATAMRAEEMTLSVPDGRSVKTLVNVTPIHGEDGAVASVVVTVQDLAPFEELDRLRAAFVDMVSHELRAPLASIKGSAATVLGARPVPAPAEMLQFFRIIDGQADRMRGLIADLLDAGSIEAGTLAVVPEPADVSSLVDQARNTFLSGGGRHALLIDLPPDLPRVMADRERIVQVLNNLFDNAARHAPESSPIRIEAARHGAHVAVSVSDRGQGIPAERMPQLFRKRARLADGEGNGGAGGTGLGLAICKGLVEAHGGRIRAESGGAGQGARFTFTIPVADDNAGATPGEAPGGARASQGGGERTRILAVDDDPHTLRQVRDTLSEAGYAPLVTGDPGELARLIRTRRPRLVLLDLMLPGTDGIALMEQVPELADLPVIFISGYGRDETVARALESGAADYIVKPFSSTELTARVAAALRRTAGAEPFVLGDLAIHYDERRASLAGRAVPLTATEWEVLRILSVNAGRVVTSESLLRQAWNARDAADTEPVRAFVKKLRAKLGDDASDPAYIFTERGVGYRMPRPG
ncbi:MAG: ATP-binding protein [Defluviicoccus sp.]|nr:ATP-binding protein [Defluviicoccus sp.]